MGVLVLCITTSVVLPVLTGNVITDMVLLVLLRICDLMEDCYAPLVVSSLQL